MAAAIHTFSTLPSSPFHLKRDLRLSNSISSRLLKTPISHSYGSISLPAGRRTPLLLNNNPTVVAATTKIELESAAEVVRKFYGGINGRDLASVEDLIALNCIYEDLVFPRPFVGRKAILEFFKEFIDSISTDLQFAIDDISEEDTSAVGVTWHLEWKGKPFPFSKGCSFYRLDVVNAQRQIVYGRDSVEPAIKPGETALVWVLGAIPGKVRAGADGDDHPAELISFLSTFPRERDVMDALVHDDGFSKDAAQWVVTNLRQTGIDESSSSTSSFPWIIFMCASKILLLCYII